MVNGEGGPLEERFCGREGIALLVKECDDEEQRGSCGDERGHSLQGNHIRRCCGVERTMDLTSNYEIISCKGGRRTVRFACQECGTSS